MQEPSKDNSGEKIFVKKKDLPVDYQLDIPGDMVPSDPTGHYNETPADLDSYAFDSHDHLIVKHDLFNHDGLTQDGIAETFLEFAKREKLSFALPGKA